MNIYLDNAATTTARPEVIETMLPLLAGGYNPSSQHAHGRAARGALDDARADVARVLGAEPREIVFTGGGSEADGLAITGVAKARAAEGKHVITTVFEHHAVLHAFDVLESEGWTVTRLPVGADGVVDPAAVAAALRPDTTLVSVMLGNNEIGTIQPLAEIAAAAHASGALVHTDAVATAGYLDLDLRRLDVDLLSLSAHKFNGPKGVGVLFVRRGTPLVAQIVGGGQEHGLRAGTENLAGVAGLARALTLAHAERAADVARVTALREQLAGAILAAVPDAVVLGAGAPRVPHILSVGFPGLRSDTLLMALDLEGVSASAGSACAAGSLEPSHVVAALGVSPEVATSVLRFSLGRSTTGADIEGAAAAVGRVVERMRAANV
ncbi:MAG: cysteine desulfurase family protein [Candidatus Lustribacter sp.]|jgi:cysteine desulfurase